MVGLRVLDHLAQCGSSLFLLDAFSDEHHHVAAWRRLLKDALTRNAEPSQHLRVGLGSLARRDFIREPSPPSNAHPGRIPNPPRQPRDRVPAVPPQA
jgi:hypothetical protein